MLLGVLAAVLVLTGSPISARAQANGMYADFTTSMGSFTCLLDYTNAPKAVANFIGLATGQKAWLDATEGGARTNAFYNGLTFHRVIANFMIQGGSQDATGADDPGYAFLDEFAPSMKFDAFGKLAMANSGTNSNGAQFFITVANAAWLNNVHTVFGKVTSGSNVVFAISRVVTSGPPADKPLTNVVIQQVAIRRVGAAAQAFNIHGQGLPVVTNLPLTIARSQNLVALSVSNRVYAGNHIFAAQNLNGPWGHNSLGISPPSHVSAYADTLAPQGYFRLTQVQYAHNTLAPLNLYNRTLTCVFKGTNYFGTNRIAFDDKDGGTFSFARTNASSNGTLSGYMWEQEPYRAVLTVAVPGYPVMKIKQDFTSPAAGRFRGNCLPFYPFEILGDFIEGTFTLTGP
ncbi:MAG TPA: peptidylprolyl isomerase [Clostridia bacterium]|nr:peptidylprolyl isomerase [Clostridia bacterium]